MCVFHFFPCLIFFAYLSVSQTPHSLALLLLPHRSPRPTHTHTPVTPPPPSSISILSSSIRLGEERCSTHGSACQERTPLVSWAEGEKKMIFHLLNPIQATSPAQSSYLQGTRGLKKREKKRKEPRKEDCDKTPPTKMLLRGFLIIIIFFSHIFHVKLQERRWK